MAKKRQNRAEINHENFNILKPIDVLSLGSKDDPCFGKHHDLLAEECIICGDSEFCAIAMAQTLNVKRLEIESEQRFKDIEEVAIINNNRKKEAREMLENLKNNGVKRIRACTTVHHKTGVDFKELKELYNEIK